MKLAVILPIPMIEEWTPKAGTLFRMHLCLADKVLGDDSYRQAYADAVKRGEYVIIDNGAAENGSSVPAKELLEAAHAVGAQEIVAPDVLEDSHGTLQLTEEFLSEVGQQLQNSKIKIMVVPQGKTGYEWQMCAQTLYSMLKHLELQKHIVIGVPKHLDNKVAGGRATTLASVVGGWGAPFKFHLLGSGETLCRDIAAGKVLKCIRSMDTSIPSAFAQSGRKLLTGFGRNGTLCDFHSPCDTRLLGLNLLEVKKWMLKGWVCPTGLKSGLTVPACEWCPSKKKL